MLSSLLVQLFGRDVIDRLDAAGFETNAAIAAEGPDGLVRSAGIAPDLATRIVALAREIPDDDPANPQPGRPATPEPRLEASPTPDQPAFIDPQCSIDPSDVPMEASPTIESPAPGEESPPLRLENETSDPFVDAGGLVSWMGFAVSAGPGGALASSVADAILDTPRAPAGERQPLSDESSRPRRKQPRATDALDNITLEGTFWSFGHRPHPGAAKPPTPASTVPGKDDGGTRLDRDSAIGFLHHGRRNYDGH